jgi:hypothetical protein
MAPMRARLALVALLTLVVSGCGPTVDLKTALQTTDVSTGWFDLGVVDGKNKLVPSVTFSFKNVGTQTLSTLQANVIFRRAGEDEEWGNGFVRVAGSEGLAGGAVSKPVAVNSQLGYTGSESRQQMMSNSGFKDARVQIFAKYGSTQWTLITEAPIERRLIAK